MPHIHIILDNHLKGMRDLALAANDSTLAGLIETLRTKSHDLNHALEEGQIPTIERKPAYDLLEEIQGYAINTFDNNLVIGQDSTVQGYIDAVDDYL